MAEKFIFTRFHCKEDDGDKEDKEDDEHGKQNTNIAMMILYLPACVLKFWLIAPMVEIGRLTAFTTIL